MNKQPPLTERYCLNCKGKRNYQYSRMLNHSYCTVCGHSSLYSVKIQLKKKRESDDIIIKNIMEKKK
jgi:hypothetical protein